MPKEADETLLAAHQAADQSQWDKYLSVMVGADCPRKDRPTELIYKAPINLITGVLSENQYGELKDESIYGLEHGSVRINTALILGKFVGLTSLARFHLEFCQ